MSEVNQDHIMLAVSNPGPTAEFPEPVDGSQTSATYLSTFDSVTCFHSFVSWARETKGGRISLIASWGSPGGR